MKRLYPHAQTTFGIIIAQWLMMSMAKMGYILKKNVLLQPQKSMKKANEP